MRQSGTVVLALALVWLLVLAEGRGRHGMEPPAEATRSEMLQVAPVAVAVPRRIRLPRQPGERIPVAGDLAGEAAARHCRRGIQLLI